MRNKQQISDIIIVGAGLIGLSLANLCARQGFSVALIERGSGFSADSQTVPSSFRSNFPSDSTIRKQPDDFDLRCFAISRGTQNIFTKLNIWDNVIEPNATAYSRMTVWDAAGFGEINFDAKEVRELNLGEKNLGEPNLGHIIEQRILLQSLWQITRDEENITLFLNQSPTVINVEDNHVFITLENGHTLTTTLTAKLVVGAEGAHSIVREKVGIEIKQKSYHQHALVATLQTEYSHQNTAWQRFFPEGPLAFLPLSDPHFCSIVWTASPDITQQNLQLTPPQFCEAAANALDYRLGKIISCSERKSFPLTMIHAKHYVKPRVAIIGDAAHVIHPLAGQGVNLGMLDVMKLAEVLLQSKQRDCDIGDILILRKYERARKGPANRMIFGMKFFKELFGMQSEAFSIVRSLGLNITNKTPFLKRKFIKEAMGI